jgi:lipoate---protein ligase
MFCINLDTTDPYFNLAVEESLLKRSKEEYFILGINRPCVIIGKHQSAYMEVNTKFVNENRIPVIRRISGGGTVFHDYGNLNFSFIKNSEGGKQVDFMKYTQPVIDFLKSMGVEARFEGKNDLRVDGLKISGNAEHVFGNRVLHHGTLLFSASLEMLRNSLRNDTSYYTSKAVVSNPSSVLNLGEKLHCFRNIDEFRTEMMNFFLKNFPENFPYDLNQEEIQQAHSLADAKFRTWEWNWAYGPQYTFKRRINIGKIDHSCVMLVIDGIISECTIEGSSQMKIAAKKIVGCKHMFDDLSEIFRIENIILTEEEIYNFF